MDPVWLIVVLFAVGLILLLLDIFFPSHGLLTVGGLGSLVVAVALTFQFGKFAGGLATIACLIVLPALAWGAIKIWPHTPIGKRIAPINRVADAQDRVNATELLEPLIGKFGRALSPLRPIGLCEFGGRRVECVAELGMIEAESCVEATGIRGSALTVRVAKSRAAAV